MFSSVADPDPVGSGLFGSPGSGFGSGSKKWTRSATLVFRTKKKKKNEKRVDTSITKGEEGEEVDQPER